MCLCATVVLSLSRTQEIVDYNTAILFLDFSFFSVTEFSENIQGKLQCLIVAIKWPDGSQWLIQDFPGGTQPLNRCRQPSTWPFFSQKLHENEEIFAQRRAPVVPP